MSADVANSTVVVVECPQISTEFPDRGQSRAIPWKRRLGSARLLAALANPDRGFDAGMIGELARAFCGNQ